jgi:hypothetical protein
LKNIPINLAPKVPVRSSVLALIGAIGLANKTRWAAPLSLIVAWVIFLVYAIIVIPDWEDALQENISGLNYWSFSVSLLALIVIIFIRNDRKTGKI